MYESGVVVPQYVLSRVFRKRDTITDDVLGDYHGYALTGEDFADFVHVFAIALPEVTSDTVLQSVHHLAGITLTRKVIRETVWRLVGNLERLQAGVPSRPWMSQAAKEWVPVQVLDYQRHRTYDGRAGGLFKLQVYAGTPCPLILTQFWTMGFMGMIARRIGFSAPWGRYPYQHPSELVNMRIMVLMDPEKCYQRRPGFSDICYTSGLLKWNRGIIKKRMHIDWKCPRGFQVECNACPVGYLECPAATHKDTYGDLKQFSEVENKNEQPAVASPQ